MYLILSYVCHFLHISWDWCHRVSIYTSESVFHKLISMDTCFLLGNWPPFWTSQCLDTQCLSCSTGLTHPSSQMKVTCAPSWRFSGTNTWPLGSWSRKSSHDVTRRKQRQEIRLQCKSKEIDLETSGGTCPCQGCRALISLGYAGKCALQDGVYAHSWRSLSAQWKRQHCCLVCPHYVRFLKKADNQ